jgi:hypothetical protein
MGTKGSFIIASATNTVFIDMLLANLYGNGTTHDMFYITVGDDMVIQDPKDLVRTKFEEIGVPINLDKSKRFANNNAYVEFVSRNAVNTNDYSLISPSLVSKTRRQHYYVRTLVEHLNERCSVSFKVGQLLDIIDMKDIHKDKIILFNSLFDLALEEDSIEYAKSYEQHSLGDSTELCTLAQNCLLLLGDSFWKFVSDKDLREKLINNERALIAYTTMKIKDPSSLWEHAVSEEFSLDQLEIMMLFSDFKEIREVQLVKGLEISLEKFSSEVFGVQTTLYQTFHRLFKLIITLDKQILLTSMRISTLSSKVSANSYLHKANLELFKFLSKAISLDRSTLDISNCERALEFLQAKIVYDHICVIASDPNCKVVISDLVPVMDSSVEEGPNGPDIDTS